MSKRINIAQLEPEAYKALLGFEKYLADSKLQPIHKELIKIRASQINGCAFCLNMHTKEARALGETEQRIYLVSVWRDTATLFTPEEKAILALTEEMTLIQQHISDTTYQNAAELFDKNYLAQLMMMIITINSWNRFAIATEMQIE